jgi:transketolase
MKEVVSKPFAHSLKSHGSVNEKLVVVTNDLTASCEADLFAQAFPDRHISAGMAEQAIIATLSGLSDEGLYPLYPSFAVFTTRRPYEQIALTIAYPAKKVRLFGFLPGLTTPGGVTHQAIDDLGLMTQLPNMTVLEAADATDMSTILDAVKDIPGPIYVRGLRGEVPQLFKEPLVVGQSRDIFPGEQVVVLATGSMVAIAIKEVEHLRSEFPELGLICINTLKPFGDKNLFERLKKAKIVITYENHLISSGLAKAVALHIAQNPGPKLMPIGVDDTFTHGGTQDYLFNYYGIGKTSLISAIYEAFGKSSLKSESNTDLNKSEILLNKSVAEGL